jgi:hypothetical protein
MNPPIDLKADCERLRKACSEAEFQTLRTRIVDGLKKEYPVETGNPRLFYDNGANLIMPSSAFPKGLEAWITAQIRPVPCGGHFGAQQIWEGSLEGRRERMAHALSVAHDMCQQERIERPKREKALEKKITEWQDRMYDHMVHCHKLQRLRGDIYPNYRKFGESRILIDAMKAAFEKDRTTYEGMIVPPIGLYDCPITNRILAFVDEKERAIVKEAKEKRKREKESNEKRKADLLANAVVEALVRRGL